MIISQTATLLLVPKNSSAQKKNREDNAKSHFTAQKQTPFPCLFRQKPHWGNAVRIFYKQKGHCKRYDNTDMVND